MTILKKTNTCEEQFMKKKRSVFRTRARTQKGSGQPENPEPLNGILYKTNYYYFNSQNPTIWSELVVVGPTKAAFFHMAEGSLAPSSPWLAWQLPLVSMHVLSLSLSLSLSHTHTHTHTHTRTSMETIYIYIYPFSCFYFGLGQSLWPRWGPFPNLLVFAQVLTRGIYPLHDLNHNFDMWREKNYGCFLF
jgi:hypothetical protein